MAGANSNCEVKLPGLEETYKVEEVSAHLLDFMKKIAEKEAGGSIKNPVITIPAYFS